MRLHLSIYRHNNKQKFVANKDGKKKSKYRIHCQNIVYFMYSFAKYYINYFFVALLYVFCISQTLCIVLVLFFCEYSHLFDFTLSFNYIFLILLLFFALTAMTICTYLDNFIAGPCLLICT